jgi:hypothetical protein
MGTARLRKSAAAPCANSVQHMVRPGLATAETLGMAGVDEVRNHA